MGGRGEYAHFHPNSRKWGVANGVNGVNESEIGFNGGAERRARHAVPPMPGGCGESGSIVGRCIETVMPWAELQKRFDKKGD